MIDQALLLVGQTALISVPFVFAALGGTCSERGGVVNIALEGILLGSAFAAAVVAFFTKSAELGLLAGVLAGVAVGALHAFLAVNMSIDQIIAGLAINILMAGATSYGAELVWPGGADRAIPGLSRWEFGISGAFGDFVETLFGTPLVVLAGLAVVFTWFLLERSRFGLRLSAIGEAPSAADTAGLSVSWMRWQGVLLSGLLGGAGGAWLALNIHQFQEGMSAGKGYIAMAAVVCGRWRPLGATLACLLFGSSGAFAAALERFGTPVPSELVSVLPHALTIVLVAGLIGRARAPASLGIPYEK